MVGMELNLALVVRQLPVESAYGLHALPPVLRQGFGSRGEGVADHPLVQLTSALKSKNEDVKMRVSVKIRDFFLQKSGKKQIKISREKDFINVAKN
jgi:hypothetical protein